MSGIEGEVLNSALTSGFGGLIAYLVIKEVKEFRKEVMSEISRLKEAYYILIDAQTDELKKKFGRQSSVAGRDALNHSGVKKWH